MRNFYIAIVAILLSSTAGMAQECSTTVSVTRFCNAMVQASEIMQARAGIGLVAGNPVPGANSTLGMRIRRTPRISLALRTSAVGLDMPGLNEPTLTTLVPTVNVDAAVGVFGGKMLAPTIGGFGSLDVVASAGKMLLSNKDGFPTDPGSWAIGARVGILRESFTAPGISITGMYRHVGDISARSSNVPSGGHDDFALTNNSVLSLRGVIGKRLFVVGANAGLGYDSFRSDVTASSTGIGPVSEVSSASQSGRKLGRMTGFVNATWTMLIVNFVAEAGFQRGGDTFAAPLPSGQSSKTQKTGYYGSLALRLAL